MASLVGGVLLVTTLVAGSATALAPTIGVSRPVSSPVYGLASDQQRFPAIASNGTNYLAVWQDSRAGSSGIWGSILTSSGEPLSGAGIKIVGSGQSPAVASDGTDYLVVWGTSTIFGAIVRANGTVAAPGVFTIYETPGFSQQEPSVAFDGTRYLVAWTDYSGGDADITGARVSRTGSVGAPIDISSATGSQSGAAVASNGSGWFVAWGTYEADDDGDVYGTAVASTAVVADPGGLELAATDGMESGANLASNGTDYLLAWSAYVTGTSLTAISASRLDGDGTVLDATGIEIAPGGDYLVPGGIASDGTDYLATWFEWTGDDSTSKTLATRVTSAGVADPAGIEVGPMVGGNLSQVADVASDGTDYMTVFGDDDIVSRAVQADGTPVGVQEVVALSAATQATGDLAAGSDGYLAVWQETRGGDPAAVMAGRLATDGTALDGAGIAVSSSIQSEITPSVAWNGTNYLVVWIDYRYGIGSAPDLVGVRLDADGTVLDLAPIEIDVGSDQIHQGQIDVASDGTDFLVVWSAGSNSDVYARVVESDGTVPEPRLTIAADAGNQTSPTVAASGSRYLVAWVDGAVEPTDGIRAAAVTPGEVDPVDPPMDLTEDAYFPLQPMVASDGSGFLVTWAQAPESGTPYDLWTARFDSDGQALGAAAALPGADPQMEIPRASTWDGSNYVVYYNLTLPPSGSADVARRIAADGTVVDAEPFVVSGGGVQPLSVASSSAGYPIFLYSRFAAEEEYGSVNRLFTRRMIDPIPGSVMQAPTAPFQKSKAFRVAWTRPSDTADVRVKTATSKATFGAHTSWKTDTASTQATYSGKPGNTYCFSARSRTTDGDLSGFSSQRCTAVPLDDRALKSAGSWTKKKAMGYYLNTFSQTSQKGATLSGKVRGKRFALVATRCPKCGTVKVFFGKKLLKKVSLKSATLKKRQLIPLRSLGAARTGKVRVVVVSSGKLVRIEGLGTSAV
jgi:hypothetical protein